MTESNTAAISNRLHRDGLAVTEVVVAASLLATGMAIILPMVVRSNRLRHNTNTKMMVIDALSSQVERLTHLESADREDAIADIEAPEHIIAALPSAKLTAKIVDDNDGKRIIVALDWDRIGDPPPVSLVAWIDAFPEAVSPESQRSDNE